MQVNSNGILSFWQPFSSSFIRQFPLFTVPLIAPYWENFDLRRGGNIFYRQTSNTTLLQRVQNQLQESFPPAGDFSPTRLFIATWERVPGFLQSLGLVGTCNSLIQTKSECHLFWYWFAVYSVSSSPNASTPLATAYCYLLLLGLN